MNKRLIVSVGLILMTIISGYTQIFSNEPLVIATRKDSIISALNYHIREFPNSQLKDIYKSFMQDYFGPGHILADTVAAAAYLRNELMENTIFLGPKYERTGYEGNFYRVNISLIREGIVPYQVFFNAFVDSVQGISPPSNNDWMAKWKEIETIIDSENYDFPDKESDKRELHEQFAKGKYIAHHSKRFNETHKFHYRIISRDIFINRIFPYIKALNNYESWLNF